MKKSHRNNEAICDFSSKLYPDFEKSEPCECEECRNASEHDGVFIVKPGDVNSYLEQYNPVQLRWNKSVEVNSTFSYTNMGESKGQTHDRVLIYPTEGMSEWVTDNNSDLKEGARAKFYVAITRARHSAAIVYDYDVSVDIDGTIKYVAD